MDLLVIGLIIICLWGAKISFAGHPDYIGQAQTGAIKGIFAVLILYSHMRGYLTPEAATGHDGLYYGLLNFMGQLIVVMFLFYSGYGVMESLKRDANKYMDNFLTHRLLKVWIMFAIAVGFFLGLSLALGRDYPRANYFLCWIGWESIGNSNWFVFDILALYLLTYIGILIGRRLKMNLTRCAGLVFLLTAAFLVILFAAGKDYYWYDTILAYPLGMFYSIYRERIEKALSGWKWAACFAVAVSLFIILYVILPNAVGRSGLIGRGISFVCFMVHSSFFAFAFVLLTMKLKLDNRVLRWLGTNAFAIYILQRLSMIVCSHYGLNGNSLLFSAVVIPSTLLIAAIYTAATNRLNRKLFR